MRLARIVTSIPEQVSAAAEHLRAAGYAVEIVPPGQASPGDADLHVDAVGCGPEEALSRAVEAAQQKPRRVVAYDLTGRPVEFADDEEDTKPAAGVWDRVRAGAREIGENLRLPVDHLREWVQEGRDSISQKRAERDTRRADEVKRRARLDFERAQTEEAERARRGEEEARQDAIRQQRVREEAEQRARQEAEERTQQALAERERQAALEREREARRAAELRREEQERARQAALAAEQHRREQEHAEEQARLARERQLREEQEARLTRERQLRAEEEQHRVAEQQRLARVTEEREQFARQQAQAAGNIAAAEAAVQRRPELVRRPSARRDNDFQKAMFAAAALALLATLGYAAYEARRPATPLSNRDLVRSQAITQPVPFGAATATPAVSATRPQQVLPQSSVAPPPAAKPTAAKPRAGARSRHGRDNAVADDEVVIHRRSAPAAATVATGSGTKHYSDIEQ